MKIELAKTGTWSGKKLTKSMINDAAGNFADPVPVIVGHESAFWSDAAPAVGWIEGVEVKGNTLIGDVRLNAEGQKLWDAKSFRTWSVGLAKTDDSSPWELAHLALLGATNPAVKGLKVLEFSEGQPKHRMAFINFSESEEDTMDIEKLKEEFAAKEAALKAEFAAKETAKDAELLALKTEKAAVEKAAFSAKVESVFKSAEGKAPAEKVNEIKALFSKEGVTLGEILDGINAMFAAMPPMVATGKHTPAGDTQKPSDPLQLTKSGLV